MEKRSKRKREDELILPRLTRSLATYWSKTAGDQPSGNIASPFLYESPAVVNNCNRRWLQTWGSAEAFSTMHYDVIMSSLASGEDKQKQQWQTQHIYQL
jgi:hypothetical protein